MAGRNLWTAEQDAYLAAHWQDQTDEELAAAVGHPVTSTQVRRIQLGFRHRISSKGPDWSQEELDYIREVWGEKTVPQIARHLGRSINAVKVKTTRLGYTGQKWSGEMMSARKVSELMGVDVHAVCDYWIPKCGLKGKKRRLGVSKKTTTIIMFGDLLQWLESHQELWDSRRVELYGLGMEYDWLVEKRKADALKPSRKAQPWTPEEDSRLIYLFRRGDLTYAQIGEELHRPTAGVERRLKRLDVWGDGRYIGEKNRAKSASLKENFERKCLAIRLRNALLARRNSMDFGAFWQKDICLLWDKTKGCTAGCSDCDTCTDFQRIPPQYCARCGRTFIEREANRFCAECRLARKKKAQRHWCRTSKK